MILTGGIMVFADTRFVVDCVCPLCQTAFKATLAGSGTMFNRRLDLRPVGAIASPWPVAVCPKCGFVLYKDKREEYPDAELKELRNFVNSDEYRKLSPKAPSYQRLARLYEALKRPPFEVAYTYLEASWQAEGQEELNRALLEKSREWFEKYLASSQENEERWKTAEFLRGELLRRLGQFAEAEKQFDRLRGRKEFAEEPFPQLLSQERSLIQARDASPKEIVRPGKR
jgi:tetratricopeptide (TPR) repeat protein